MFEDIQLQNNNVVVYKTLAKVLGVIEELLVEMNIPHTLILAASWRSILKIKGRVRSEQKHNAQKYVMTTYGIKVEEDTADAICIGTAHINENRCAWE